MAKAMSERLGVPFTFEGTSFDVIIPGLASKRYDAGFSSFGVTEERLQALDFIPQRKEGTGYAFLKAKPLKIAAEKDLCGHSVALLTGAWDFQYLTKVSAEQCAGRKPIDLQQFTTENAAELAVSSGRVEIVAAGEPEDLAELKAALRKGSRGSRVDAVVEHELAESEATHLGPFEIEGAW